MLLKMLDKENPSTLLVGMQIGTTTVEISMKGTQKTKTELPDEPCGHLPKGLLKSAHPRLLQHQSAESG